MPFKNEILQRKLEERRRQKWEQTHKLIDGVDHKQCNMCKEYLPANQLYFYKNNSNEVDGLNPYCRKCSKDKTKMWREENPEKHKVLYLKRNATDKNQESMKVLNEKRRKDGKHKEWLANNPDKARKYSSQRYQKNHKINKREWTNCKEYFNNSCAYCEKSWAQNKLETKKDLHREHVDPNGADDLSNCIPACASCNTSKHTYSLDEWYVEDNHRFNEVRLAKILKWINVDYKMHIDNKH